MYSQCPECLTRFRVTAAALRAARGTVRCGRCGSAFDALPRLTDTPPEEQERRSRLPPSLAPYPASGLTGAAMESGGAGDAVVTDFHFSADDIERVFIDARDWQQRFGTEGERAARGNQEAPTNPAPGTPVVLVHEPEAIEDITLEGERIVIEGLPELDDDLREVIRDDELLSTGTGQDDAVRLPGGQPPPVDLDSTDRFEALRHVPGSYPVLAEDVAPHEDGDAAPGTAPRVVEADAATAPAAMTPATAPAHAASTAETAPAPAAPQPPIVPFRLRPREYSVDETLGDDDQASGETRHRASLAWGLGALLLAITLAAQVTHHYRQDLARDANFGPIVRSIYARLGWPIAPNWDLAAFELRQWGASEGAPSADGSMTVRASLRNDADFAQPMPLLRLELEDRFGGTVARRDFEPREWLKDPAQASRLLSPGAKTEAELDVADAGSDAVGYRLDVCMRDESGLVSCAQDGADPQ